MKSNIKKQLKLVSHEEFQLLSDSIVGLCFLIGSILFFWPSTERAGIWFFIIGSAQLVINPVAKLHGQRRQRLALRQFLRKKLKI